MDPTDGGRVRSGTGGLYYRQEDSGGGVLKVDAFATRSLFDLYSNFTFFLNDPVHGDAIQQHDSRLIEGANAQYERPHKIAGRSGAAHRGRQLPRQPDQRRACIRARIACPPASPRATTQVVTNGAAFAQESVTLLGGRMVARRGHPARRVPLRRGGPRREWR